MNTEQFLRTVDHAAGMNDRWLFLAAFLLLLLLCGATIWWLVRQLQSVITEYKTSQEAHQGALAEIVKAQNEMALKLAVCIDRNTAALEKCTFELQRIQEKR